MDKQRKWKEQEQKKCHKSLVVTVTVTVTASELRPITGIVMKKWSLAICPHLMFLPQLDAQEGWSLPNQDVARGKWQAKNGMRGLPFYTPMEPTST